MTMAQQPFEDGCISYLKKWIAFSPGQPMNLRPKNENSPPPRSGTLILPVSFYLHALLQLLQHSSADLQILRKEQDVVDIGQFTATHDSII